MPAVVICSLRHSPIDAVSRRSIVFDFKQLALSVDLRNAIRRDSVFGMQSANAIHDGFRTPAPMRRFLILLAAVSAASAQDSFGTHPILLPGDMAVLDADEGRKDLMCAVTPEKPLLGFDLKFHAGFSVNIPIRELEGPGDLLTTLFRVTPKGAGTESNPDPVYFHQQFRVPPISSADGGTATLEGVFDVGEGSYHVDWFVHDYAGRFCSAYWDVEAARAPKDRQVTLALPPLTVRPNEDEQFQPEPPVIRSLDESPLNIKVLMNFAPQRPDSAALDPVDRMALISILRNLSRNPQIGKFSLVAFNLQEQQVLYRQDSSDHIDFPRLGEALKQLSLGTVDLRQLEKKHPDTEFLSALFKKETGEPNLDGLIVVGPKALLDANVPDDELKQIGDLDYPLFYMNYSLQPNLIPWKDSISRVVRFFKGREYTISGPRDLWNAVTEVVSRISKSRQARTRPATGY